MNVLVVSDATGVDGANSLPGAPIQVAIVSSQRLVGDAVAALLNHEPDMTVIGNVDYGDASQLMVSARRADIVIVDFRMNVRAVAGAAIRLRRSGWTAPLIALTQTETDAVLLAAIEAEASALICATGAGADLITAVRSTVTGKTLIRPEVVASVLSRRKLGDEPHSRLTQREYEILYLLAEGVASRDIGSRLGIKYVTVRTHLRNLASKLAAHSKLEVVAKAHRLNLVGDARPGRLLAHVDRN